MNFTKRKCYLIKCPYLADDGTCLLEEDERKEKCLALEKISHEEKDEEWFCWCEENESD